MLFGRNAHNSNFKMFCDKLILFSLSVFTSLTWAAISTPQSTFVVTPPNLPRPSASLSGSRLPLLENVEFTIENDLTKKDKPRVYSMEIETDIRLRYATTKVSSRVANPHSNATEAMFYIVLPETAFISSFLMEIEGKVYKALVKEKEKAQDEYDKAVSLGQTAAQVSSSARDANQFTVSVNIEPNSKVTFNLTYEELLTRRQGVYEHKVHINPGTVVPELRVRTNIIEVLPITDIKVLPFENEIGEKFSKETAEIININATTSTILFEPTEQQQKKISESGLNGHLTIQYDVDRSTLKQRGGEIHVVDGYFVHFFAPSALPTLPKHVVFVLDTSGSMAGIRLEQTKEAMESILGQLRSEDIFSVVEFASESREWNLKQEYEPFEPDYYEGSVESSTISDQELPDKVGDYDDIFAYPVSELSIKLAKNFIRRMDANGGTNINDALVLALKNTQSLLSRTKRTPIIIFLTDGEPTVGEVNTGVITENVKKANSDGLVSIFSLAFGTDADFSLQKKISNQNRGFARKIYEGSDTTLQLEGFFTEIASPLLNNVRFTYEGLVTEVTETKIPNFFKGTEWCTVGRLPVPLPPSLPFKAIVEATGSAGPLVFTSSNIAPPEKPEKEEEKKSFSLEKMWAYSTIQHLLKQSETDPDNITFKEKALNLSLTYGFVTPLTSLLVIKPDDKPTASELQPTFPGVTSGSLPNLQSFSAPPSFNGFGTPSIAGLKRPSLSFISAQPVFELEEEIFEKDTESPITTSTIQSVTEVTVTEQEEAGQYGTEPACYDGPQTDMDHGIPFCDSYWKREIISKWIGNFPHNETHMSIAMNNSTLSLVTLNELPNKGYQECNSENNSTATFRCKSMWHCDLRTLRENLILKPLSLDSICVIEDKFVGFCCKSSII